LPDPEMRVLKALDRHADVVLTQTEQSGAASVRATIALVRAASIEREVEEIARRILEQVSGGRPFREIGIIVRTAETYVPILRSTLERFGIPARFYFDSKLDQHSAVRFLTGAL